MPALLDHVTSEAAKAGEQEFSFQVPFINRIAVRHLLGRGGKIEPFYVEILASGDAMRLDRWIHTTPMYIL
ncbi:MAG: hypothetical protein FJX63_07040 [Alphaproteobacteria bacterium]|nr:hypothetical protein [Alphaproteobacteria bacterium]